MELTFQKLNEFEAAGVVTRYAVAGAFALSFYSEPVVTFDLDVFVSLPDATSKLVTLTPIYDHFRALGCEEQREHIVIHGTPVQFIPAYNPLIEETVREAKDMSFKSLRVRVARLEHLFAIMLQTGRSKDSARLAQLIPDTSFDKPLFEAILARHYLGPAWAKFQSRFL